VPSPNKQSILFFADRLPPLTGGVEMHGRYFIEYFTNHREFPLTNIITKNTDGQDCLLRNNSCQPITIRHLSETINPAFVFFNSGRWIEELPQIRALFPKSFFLYRTGGNEILKASLIQQHIPSHLLRQSYWAKNINQTIDAMITNSAYTETRLRSIGVTCAFKRFVGGVNAKSLVPSDKPIAAKNAPIVIFCAARFVPYKNHSLLLSVIKELVLRGHKLNVRLAGDGPLLDQAKELTRKENLTSIVEFLGVLDNEKVCQETVRADVYMQLSGDEVTEVPGGSYIHSEGMGRSILEALTAGTFVIAGLSGALPEIVTKDRGALIPLTTLEQVATEIDRLMSCLPTRSPFTDCFSWENIFTKYESLLRGFSEHTSRH